MFFKRRIGFTVLAISLSLLSGCAAIDRFIDQPPTAVMTVSPSSGAITGSQITLSAAKSSDPQGYALQYSWTLTVPSSSISALNVTDAVTVTFTPDIGGTYTVDLQITASSSSKKSAQASKAISVTTAAVTQAAATPTFSPAAGNFTVDQSVTISCTTQNASIYYTTDGVTTPTTASTLYTGAISVAGNGTTKTIKAIATATGYMTSAVGSATYTINYAAAATQAATPVFSPVAGSYTSTQSVMLSSDTSGATIRYTTDNTTPTSTTGILYSGAITVSASQTIKAIAYLSGWTDSIVSSAAYVINLPSSLLTMLPVTGGSFNNGTSMVTLSSFRMSATEVTQAQYATVTGNSPSYFTGDTSRPVEQVTWYDAVEFCNKLSVTEGLTPAYTISARSPATGYPITSATVAMDMSKNGYRLPTEAEWEFAARGGTQTHGYSYAGSNTKDGVAWYYNNSGGSTHPVGGKTANELGLYDMSGNVWEWVWDLYGSYPSGAQTDPVGASSGSDRVIRGGGWDIGALYWTVASRINVVPSYRDAIGGLRVVSRP